MAAATVRTLERRVKRLERELEAARAGHQRRLEQTRRAANRRLAAMMHEIATLRHHEARAALLERALATRPGGGGQGGAAPGGRERAENGANAAHASATPRVADRAREGTPDGEDPRLPG